MSKLSGKIIPGAYPADRKLIGKANKKADFVRRALLRRGFREQDILFMYFNPAFSEIAKILSSASIVSGQFDATTLNKLRRVAPKGLDAAFEQVHSRISAKVSESIKDSIRVQNELLKKAGLKTLSKVQRSELLDRHLRSWPREEFPFGSAKTYETRMLQLRAKAEEKVLGNVSFRLGPNTTIDMVKERIRKGLVSKGVESSKIAGGSTLKQLSRLEISEASRKANEAALDTLATAGAAYARWGLSANHPWYGGAEICEVFASQVSDITRLQLRKDGYYPGKLDLHGVYPLNYWPSYPHPFCMCSPSPWFPPGKPSLIGRIVGWFSRGF